MKRRVLHLIPSFHQGGSERQAIQLVKLLRDDGTYEIELACLEKKGILLTEADEMGYGNLEEFPLSSFYDLNFARQLRKLVRYLREAQPDILQTHDFYSNIFGMTAAKLAGVPVRIAAKRETAMRTTAQNFVERRAFGMATRIIANSKSVHDLLASAGVEKAKISVVHNGIDHERFRPGESRRNELLEKFGLPSRPCLRFVTMVANLREPVKNYPMFLRAAAKTAAQFEDTAFVVAGEGPLLGQIRSEAASLGLACRIFFTGRCMDVPGLLEVSDICVLTSTSEGFSNSILEYMAAGKPVVATRVGGADEAIVDGKTGYLVASGDDETLKEGICSLLKDHALAIEMGRLGAIRVEERFSMEAQLGRTCAIYREELTARGLS